MMALYDHIQQLRAELSQRALPHRERARVQAELARAIRDHDALDREFDRALEAFDEEGR
ncbi:MAG: hypothetical protein WDN01_02845 [Rhizomicrobium sp.]